MRPPAPRARRFLRRFTALVACLVTALAMAPVVAPPAVAAANTYANPLKSQKGADPWLVFHDGDYYLITTTFTNTSASAGCGNERSTRAQKFTWNADGTDVHQWSWLGNTCQQWSVRPA